jgi:hypothetical protein
MRLGQERYVERDEVRRAEHGVAVPAHHAQLGLGLGIADGVVIEDAHGETLSAPRHGPPDPADTEGPSVLPWTSVPGRSVRLVSVRNKYSAWVESGADSDG